VPLNFVICRLFSDDCEDSIQFLADSDELQDDVVEDAAVNKASVCIILVAEVRVVNLS